MVKKTYGNISQIGYLYSGTNISNPGNVSPINLLLPERLSQTEKKKHVVSLPQSLAQSIRGAQQKGAFKYFGNKSKAQRKGYQAVWWLLSDIYRKTILRDKKEVQLPAKAMEARYGKDNGKGSLITWYGLINFCFKQGWLVSDGTYLTGEYSKAFWLNDKIIEDWNPCIITITETVIINKLKADIKRYEKAQVQSWANTNRNLSVEITKLNLSKLRFDELELDRVCKNFLSLSLKDIKKWVKLVENDNDSIFPYPFFQLGDPSLYMMNIGRIMERYNEYVSIVFPPFKDKNSSAEKGSKAVKAEKGKKIRKGKKTQLEKENLRRRQLFASIISLLLDTEERYVFLDNKGGRLYSPITNLKKDARMALRYINEFGKKEPLINFDVKTCQPWILGITILMDCKRKGVEPHPDVLRYLELIETQDFYYAIVDCFSMHLKYIDSINPTAIDLEQARAKAREEAKKGVMQDFYSNMYYNKKSKVINNAPTKPAGRFVAQEFAAVWKWILDNKGTGSESAVPIMMQRLEADYFVDIVIPELTRLGVWCLTIHDSVIVREKDSYKVRQFIKNSMMSFFERLPIVCEEALGEEKSEFKKSA
jgi:hypothetical protein